MKQHRIELIDDIDGSEAHETIHFKWEGREHEIDLSKEHAEQFRSVLAPYLKVARKGGQPATVQAGVKVPQRARRAELIEIREWARGNGWDKLSQYGRVPRDAEQAYYDAHRER